LLQQGCKISDDLEDFASDLTLARFELEHSKGSELLGMFTSLLRAVQGGWDANKLLPYLMTEPAPRHVPSEPSVGTRGRP
jgi:hypothetical protein